MSWFFLYRRSKVQLFCRFVAAHVLDNRLARSNNPKMSLKSQHWFLVVKTLLLRATNVFVSLDFSRGESTDCCYLVLLKWADLHLTTITLWYFQVKS